MKHGAANENIATATGSAVEEPSAKKPRTAAKAKAKGTETVGPGEGTPDEKKQEKEKQAKKQLDANFQKVKVMKTRADGVLSMYHEIVLKSRTDKTCDFVETKLPELNWCKTTLDENYFGRVETQQRLLADVEHVCELCTGGEETVQNRRYYEALPVVDGGGDSDFIN